MAGQDKLSAWQFQESWWSNLISAVSFENYITTGNFKSKSSQSRVIDVISNYNIA